MNRLHAATVLSILTLAFVCPAATVETPTLDPADYALTRDTLSSPEKQKLYLRLIENFVGWTETGGHFIESDELEEGGGYFNGKGTGVTWSRGNSNMCLGYALLLTEFPERPTFTIHSIPRETLTRHMRQAMRSLCLSNRNFSKRVPGVREWGGPSWQAALEFIGCAWAARLMEGQFDTETIEWIYEVARKEADNLDKPIPKGKPGDTGSEDCCWNAPILAFAANRFPDDPRAGRWNFLGRKWAINGVSAPADAVDPQVVDGKPLREWMESENLHPDLTLENHGFWSVGYQCSPQYLAEAELAYAAAGRPIPPAYAFRIQPMWDGVTRALFLDDGDILFPHGQDWAWKTYSTIEYLARLATFHQNSAAAAYESRALQMTLKRQLAGGTGDLQVFEFGNQTTKVKRWAFAFLMHKYAPQKSAATLDDARREGFGVHSFPHNRVAIHRNALKTVSVSWHPWSQAIYVLPEGDSTFADPPFFFPYDRNSGCVSVNVKPLTGKTVRSNAHNPNRPAECVADGDIETFWVSGKGQGDPGGSPSAENPVWLDFAFEKETAIAEATILPRELYGPRDCELQVSPDGTSYRTVTRFRLDRKGERRIEFPETRGRLFRLVFTSGFDPQDDTRPRNTQVREVWLGPRTTAANPKGGIDLVLNEKRFAGNGMAILYTKAHGGGVTEHVAVLSFPDETVLYCAAFHADREARVELGPRFPLRADAPPGFRKDVAQFRGDNWLNMSEHCAFVSTRTLPKSVPSGRFYCAEETSMDVEKDEWFGYADVGIYCRQPRGETEKFAAKCVAIRPFQSGTVELAVPTSSGRMIVGVDFAKGTIVARAEDDKPSGD